MRLSLDSPHAPSRPPSLTAWVQRYRRRRSTRAFTARAVKALAELGLEVRWFNRPGRRLVREACEHCHARDPKNAHPQSLAIEFFLRFTLEYPHLIGRGVRQPALLTHAIGVLREWQLYGRIDHALAEDSIERIKAFLVARLRDMDDTDDERLEAELQIRQL